MAVYQRVVTEVIVENVVTVDGSQADADLLALALAEEDGWQIAVAGAPLPAESPYDTRYLRQIGGSLTGSLALQSSFDGGEDTTDSTSRLHLESYQRNGTNFF